MTGPLALVVLLVVAILAPGFYFVFQVESDYLERRPRGDEEEF